MIETLAHIILFGRRRTGVRVGGLYWHYCVHRSHALGLPCWRWSIYDAQCPKHNNTCYSSCPPDPFAVDIYDTDHETEF